MGSRISGQRFWRSEGNSITSRILSRLSTNIVANAYRRRLYAIASSTATYSIASQSKQHRFTSRVAATTRLRQGLPQGIERETWDLESGNTDHISLSPQHGEGDPLTNFIYDFNPGWYHRHIGHRWKQPPTTTNSVGALFEYQNSKLDRVGRTLRTLLSTLLPTSSIFVLYYVRSSLVLLGLILVFTALFALTVQLTSRARPVEIFAATTA